MSEEYCPRCVIMFEIRRNPDKAAYIVLPPHDPRCPAVARFRPQPLPPRPLRLPRMDYKGSPPTEWYERPQWPGGNPRWGRSWRYDCGFPPSRSALSSMAGAR